MYNMLLLCRNRLNSLPIQKIKVILFSVMRVQWVPRYFIWSPALILSWLLLRNWNKDLRAVVRILQRRPWDRRLAGGAPRLFDVDGPSFSECQSVCLCGPWQTQKREGAEKRSALDYAVRILIDCKCLLTRLFNQWQLCHRHLRYNRWAWLIHLLFSVAGGGCHLN